VAVVERAAVVRVVGIVVTDRRLRRVMLTDLQSAWECRTTATMKEAVVEVSVNYFLSDDPTVRQSTSS
jgi:hypothetical protein